MRKRLLLLLSLFTINSYADAGYAYRFFVDLEFEGDKIQGYIYHYSYDEFTDGNVLKYLQNTNVNKEIIIYQNIKTVNVGLNFDFAVKNSSINVKLRNLGINLLETLNFRVGGRLIEVTEEEFSMIEYSKPYVFSIKEQGNEVYESCSEMLITWTQKGNLKLEGLKLKQTLEDKFKRLGSLEGEKGSKYFQFFNCEKEKLRKKEYILITTCNAL